MDKRLCVCVCVCVCVYIYIYIYNLLSHDFSNLQNSTNFETLYQMNISDSIRIEIYFKSQIQFHAINNKYDRVYNFNFYNHFSKKTSLLYALYGNQFRYKSILVSFSWRAYYPEIKVDDEAVWHIYKGTLLQVPTVGCHGDCNKHPKWYMGMKAPRASSQIRIHDFLFECWTAY
jgi:hypothetical protein